MSCCSFGVSHAQRVGRAYSPGGAREVFFARASEPVKAEARRKREEILEFLRKNPWRSADGTQKCVRAVTKAIKRLCGRLARAVDAAGKPHPVLQDFALHLREHLLIPSGRGGGHGGTRAMTAFGGCYTYEPPPGVVWRRIED